MKAATVAVLTMLTAGAGAWSAAPESAGQRGAQNVTTITLYLKQCASCHGQQGEGKPGVRPLNGPLSFGDRLEDIEKVIREGVKGTTMQAYRGTLNDAQIRTLAEFVRDMSR